MVKILLLQLEDIMSFSSNNYNNNSANYQLMLINNSNLVLEVDLTHKQAVTTNPMEVSKEVRITI